MGFLDFVGNSYGAFVGYIILGVVVLLVLNYVIREFCYRRYGIDVCPGASGSLTRARARRREREDARVATEVQQEMDRENRRSQRRKERRAKYEVFLEPYTMLVQSSDLSIVEQDKPTLEGHGGNESSSSRSFKESDYPTAIDPMSALSTADGHAMLTLPVTANDGTPRQVEACCSICLMEYQEGDAVIWSTRKKCSHAFHDECILTYLSHGKKRCPLCRNFFVPGRAVDNQKVIVDNGTEDDVYEEPDDSSQRATEAAIIDEIRSTSRFTMDLESGSPRRRSAVEVGALSEAAETIPSTNSAHF